MQKATLHAVRICFLKCAHEDNRHIHSVVAGSPCLSKFVLLESLQTTAGTDECLTTQMLHFALETLR